MRLRRKNPLIGLPFTTVLAIVVLFHAPLAHGESVRNKIRRGNALYDRNRYDEALEVYNDAQIDAPESLELQFNIGNVNYRKNEHESAIETYRKSLATDDTELQAHATYNLGNAQYRLGEKTRDVVLWREAAESYKRAIELDRDDEDAKYNLEFVQKKLKEIESQQQKKQEQNQGQEQQEENQQDRSQQPEQQQQREQEQEQDRTEQEEGQRAEAPDESEREEESGPAPPQADEQKESLEAEDIFSILKAEEKEAREQVRAARVRPGLRVGKDW